MPSCAPRSRQMKNPWLQQLLEQRSSRIPRSLPKLKRAPAAMTMHHAFIGGLLEHVVSLIGLARAVSAHYPELDADLLLTGVVLARHRKNRRAALRARHRILHRRPSARPHHDWRRAWCATESRRFPDFRRRSPFWSSI